MATSITTSEKLNIILMDFMDAIWQHVYEDKSCPPRALKEQMINDTCVVRKIHDWMNTDREGGWVMASIEPQREGFYQAIDEDNKRGKYHFYYGRWQTLDGKKIVKWFDTGLNKKPCPSCKVKEYDNEQLQLKVTKMEEETAHLKRDINFKMTHLIVRDEVLVAFEKANREIERLKQLLGCKEAQSLENELRELQSN